MQNDLLTVEITEEMTAELARKRDPRILYVFRGGMTVTDGGSFWRLGQDDFYTMDANHDGSYLMDEAGVVGILTLSYHQVSEYLELRTHSLICSSIREDGNGGTGFRLLLRKVFSLYFSKNPADEAAFMAAAYDLVHELRENFRTRKKEEAARGAADSGRRLRQIRSYLQEHFDERISLTDLSRETYFSTAYLSKYIKKQFGKNFSEVLCDMRLENAVQDLRATNATITKIALDNGFATPMAFSKSFAARYGMTPSQYRVRALDDSAAEEKPEKELSQSLRSLVVREGGAQGIETKSMRANVSEARGFTRFWCRMINGGALRDLLRADMQDHILQIHRGLGFTHVRVWDIYAPELMVYDGNPEKRYNFVRMDAAFDFLVGNGMHPYIELGFKPVLLIRSLTNYLIHEPREKIFADNGEYGDFLDQMLRHFLNRYGIDELEQWCFEQWQDVQNGDISGYLAEFETAFSRIKAVSPKIKIGGPGISDEHEYLLEDTLKIWKNRYCYPDFISFYAYPYSRRRLAAGRIERQMDVEAKNVSANYINQLLARQRDAMHENGFWHQEVHLSEWNCTVANRNAINDSVYKGAYIVRNLLAMVGQVDVAGYWFASDLFTEYYDTERLLDGSGGLISKDGIYKPAYYGISFLNRLEPFLLASDEYSIVTANSRDSYSIVCHNYRHPNFRYYMLPDDEISAGEIRDYFDAEERAFRFRIEGVKDGKYQVKKRLIDAEHGSAQDEWRRMGFTDSLNAQDIEYLRRICVPHITIESAEARGGVLELSSTLAPNAIEHIHVYHII